MKATALIPAIALALGTVFTALPSAAEARGPARNNQTQTSAFTAEDAQTLTWMREEEKLARDVYINLYQQWNKAIFDNIAASEQRHIDAIASLMVRFDVPDPSLPGVGEFSNPEIQSMYDDLLEQGSLSLTEAFWVGATIEDVDIYDLQIAIENTEVGTLKTTY
ncbi:MAG: DUF2202 domain-containing protein, partial [Xanthomonadales bacterium]|nr:DUF2202 domain-containing protein [Xanthomonadales bacterium]